METPNLLKGYLYPSSRVARCPRFHACIASKKCQNYDRHNFECALCETRTNAAEEMIGGYLPEGEFAPDLQDAIHTLEETIHKAMAHPDQEAQVVGGQEITDKFQKQRKAADTLANFMASTNAEMEEKIMQAMVDPDIKDLLGRME